MPAAAAFIFELFDPRGRCNRKGLLMVACVLLATQVLMGLALWQTGVGFDGAAALVLKLGFFWLALAAAAKRLHDCGLSARWILWSTLILITWCFVLATTLAIAYGPEALIPGSTPFNLALAGMITPIFAATLWLHFAPGEAQANKYGPVPAGLGASSPLRAHRAPLAVAA